MKALLLTLALVACSKKDDAPAPAGDKAAPAAAADYADVDCETMTKHTSELMVKVAAEESAEKGKATDDALASAHADAVKSCEAEKSTKKLTKKQYACYMAAPSMVDAANCLL